jgi:hypothetical protein
MSTALQNAKDPAEAATSHRVSSIPLENRKMNDQSNTTAAQSAPDRLLLVRLGDLANILANVRYLNEALFMAAAGLASMDATNAFQSVMSEMENKLLIADERLEEMRGELA